MRRAFPNTCIHPAGFLTDSNYTLVWNTWDKIGRTVHSFAWYIPDQEESNQKHHWYIIGSLRWNIVPRPALSFTDWLYMFESINEPPYNPWDQGLDEISTYLNFIGILFHTFSILSFILKSQLNAQRAQFWLMCFKIRYSLKLLKSLRDVCVYWGRPGMFSETVTMKCKK